MAYFRCSTGGASGSGIPLVVTCSSAFAGLTITCSDGTTTLTDTCPSTSPYEITFNLPNTGEWTVSGTISGVTYSDSIIISDAELEFQTEIDIAVDFYSAANDTVSYTGLDNQTHTITTDASGHASATITIIGSGSTITFTSSVAKDPSNLSNDYSKAITLTRNTTEVYLMPDGTVYYWFGYDNGEFQNVTAANGWSTSGGSLANAPTHNTNTITLSGGASKTCGYGKSTTTGKQGTVHIIGYVNTTNNDAGWALTTGNNKVIPYDTSNVFCKITSTSLQHNSATNSSSNNLAIIQMGGSRTLTLSAAWIV